MQSTAPTHAAHVAMHTLMRARQGVYDGFTHTMACLNVYTVVVL